ncbi:MAG TPA: histidine kinase, partial [Cyanobacteria bacterium UBA11148]|nr:histidine kinase [Cyanobacteria bacterium UBA11148]
QTEFEQNLVNDGVRSLLLIPLLVSTSEAEESPKQLMGMVGLTSTHPNNFDQLDISHAEALIPALASALRQAAQGQFNHIHPSVEWRFLEEAERRSWGLPPEPIIFTNVHPMYGISDIRGSSDERNRSIQADLLAQFNLAVGVVDAVYQNQELPFLEQLRLDLLAYMERLNKGVMVDAEVTAVQYLRTNLEIYFDYFRQCSEEAEKAVNTYKQACTNDHQCVYVARDRYDKMIHEINNRLRETWERWQVRMQQIIPHYCDLDLTDGMDHMIYVGASINPQFTLFHLHCLRYEQLRAICDCARTCFGLRDRYDTPLQVTHLVLVQDTTVDIFHDEQTEKLFDLRGSTRDTRYEIVKKRIDKALDTQTQTRITQPGMLTLVYSTQEEWNEYQQYFRYLAREGWVDTQIQSSTVEPLQGITGLKYARVRILPAPEESANKSED